MLNFERFYELLEEQGKSVSEICNLLNIDENYFYNVETGVKEICKKHIVQIASILNSTVEYLENNETDVIMSYLEAFINTHDNAIDTICDATGLEFIEVMHWTHKARRSIVEERCKQFLKTLPDILDVPEDILIGKRLPM